MKRTIVLMLTTLVLLGISNIAFGQSAKEAVRALQKLQARVESGISYRDYGPALGDAKFEVNLFLRSPEAKQKEKLASSILSTMEHYQMAATVWQSMFVTSGPYSKFIFVEPKWEKELVDVDLLLKSYPQLRKEIKIDTADYSWLPEKYRNLPRSKTLFIPTIVDVIWKEASAQLEIAINLLSQS